MDIIAKIRLKLDELRMSQELLEDEAELPRNRVSKWAAGQGEPTARQALRISKVLRLDLVSLVDDSVEIASESPQDEKLREVHNLVRELGLDRAWRRLVGLEDETTGTPKASRVFIPVAVQDLTESDARRERERRLASPSAAKPKRKSKGTEPGREPGGV